MTKPFVERLAHAKTVLDGVNALLNKSGASLPVSIAQQFRTAADLGAAIPYWTELVEARDSARSFLDGLEGRADGDDRIEFGPAKVKFSHGRLIAIEAYLSLTWSLADRISALAGRVLCTANGGALSDAIAPKLVSHFVDDEIRKSKTAVIVFDSLQKTFGWPIGVSYAIRNHFIHDGARGDVEFFEGRTSADGFKISANGWRQIENKVGTTYKVQPANVRPQAIWPASPRDDLRLVLGFCEREMDDALGILVGSAAHALSSHVHFIVGAD